MGEQAESKRHPIRALLKLAIVVGIVYGIGRVLIQTKEKYADLTESEARDLMKEKLGPRLGEDTAAEIADQVIPKLRQRGLLRADMVSETPADTTSTATMTDMPDSGDGD